MLQRRVRGHLRRVRWLESSNDRPSGLHIFARAAYGQFAANSDIRKDPILGGRIILNHARADQNTIELFVENQMRRARILTQAPYRANR